jgi:hypothetical protein
MAPGGHSRTNSPLTTGPIATGDHQLMAEKIKIFQNYYSDSQRSELDSAFIPHNWVGNPHPQYREIALFLHFYETGRYQEAEYVGIVSQKFGRKTRISGRKVLQFIERNPGFDVYFVNPFPQNSYHSFNVWEHGNAYHPGITDLAQRLLDAACEPISIADFGRNDRETLLYCNFWVGNEKFWKKYMEFIIPLFKCITCDMSEEKRKKYFENSSHFQPVPIFPFIFERLFSTFISVRNDVRVLAYKHTREEIRTCCLHKCEWDTVYYFGEIIDEWDRMRSYNDDTRSIFRGLLKLNVNYAEIHWQISGPPY